MYNVVKFVNGAYAGTAFRAIPENVARRVSERLSSADRAAVYKAVIVV
jgi:hypothetical protein